MKSIISAAFLAILLLIPGTATAGDKGSDPDKPAATPFVVYYFYTEPRCTTCETIEKLTAQAIHSHFESALQEGTLSWQVVNIGEEPNQHYIKTYSLYTKSVVIAEIENGEPLEFRILQDVWELVHKPAEFDDYIDREISGFMQGTNE